jgi:carboxylesterase type B
MDFFGGIPYAAPPVGTLRWAPPEEPPSWKPHILDATQFGPDCYQMVDPLMNPFADPDQMSEDCLYLNIYTPAGASSAASSPPSSIKKQPPKLPVMVWFHGGAFQQGAAKRPEYDGRKLAQEERVIVVTVNYRLGALGFLVSSELGLLGNYGLMDQRAAMYWVQRQISTFGGDPDSITLFGESAGAVMIGLHLQMNNPGLFHRAILQSNPMGYQFRSIVVADFLGDTLRRTVDCRDVPCLRGEPVEEIMRAQSSLMGIPRSVGDFFTWGPTLTHQKQVALTTNGNQRRRKPWSAANNTDIYSSSHQSSSLNLEHRSFFSVEAYAKKRDSTKFAVNVSQPMLNLHLVPDEIPIIIGTNKHEGEMFVHSAFPLTMSKAVYWMFVGVLFKDSAARVLRHYRPYVTLLEEQAQAIAEEQLLEEENKQYYLDHREELEQEYEFMLANTISSTAGAATTATTTATTTASLDNDGNGKGKNRLISPETVEQLVKTFYSGGGGEEGNPPGTGPDGSSTTTTTTTKHTNQTSSWWRQALRRPKADPETIEARRRLRTEKIKERARARALKEAAKVVIDYRPVMSRIINDYLFRCPSWHYAHLLSRNRVLHTGKQQNNTNNVYVYRFSQPTHVPGYKECWGKVRRTEQPIEKWSPIHTHTHTHNITLLVHLHL